MRHLYPAALALTLTACSGDAVSPDLQPQFSKGGKGGTAAQVAITMTGAMGPLTTADGSPVLAAPSTKQFSNLTLRNVRLTLPAVIPSDAQGAEDEPDCNAYPLRTKVMDAWSYGGTDVSGEWIGEMTIWQEKNQTQNSNIRFAGVDAYGSGAEIQFTSRSTQAVQSLDENGALVLQLDNLPDGFGAGPNRLVPVGDGGLPVIFCVNVEVRAEAQ